MGYNYRLDADVYILCGFTDAMGVIDNDAIVEVINKTLSHMVSNDFGITIKDDEIDESLFDVRFRCNIDEDDLDDAMADLQSNLESLGYEVDDVYYQAY